MPGKTALLAVLLILLVVGVASANINDYNASRQLGLHLNYSPSSPSVVVDDGRNHYTVISRNLSSPVTAPSAPRFLGNASMLYDGKLLQYLNIEPSENWNASKPFTYALWVNLSSYSANSNELLMQWQVSPTIKLGWNLRYENSDGSVKFYYSNNGTIAGMNTLQWKDTVSLNTPHQIVIQNDLTNISYFRDGVLIGKNVSPPLIANIHNLTVGGYLNDNVATNNLNGWVDEINIWNTTPPITDIYKQFEVGTSLKYYAYGDSITRGTKAGSDLAEDGSDVYSEYMRRTYDVLNTSDHNYDGSGANSTWGWNNIALHYSPNVKYYIVLLGTNDRNTDIGKLSAAQTVTNLANIYNYSTANGSTTIIGINTLYQDDGVTDWKRIGNQQNNITLIQNGLAAAGIPSTKMYDKIDTIPGNGVPDEWNTSNYFDWIHPNKNGHVLMGNYLWNDLNPFNAQIYPSVFISVFWPFGIAFTDVSIGSPTAWNWSFGDGTFQTTQNPYHYWFYPGIYTVSLNASTTTQYSTNSTQVQVMKWF